MKGTVCSRQAREHMSKGQVLERGMSARGKAAAKAGMLSEQRKAQAAGCLPNVFRHTHMA